MYFIKPGEENTKMVVEEVLRVARERGIKYIVVASNTGKTADYFKSCGIEIVVVSHTYGYHEKGKNEMTVEKREELEACGMKIVTSAHVLSGAERALSTKFGGIYPVEIMAYTLRMFGQGVKVGVEISVMALDSGAIPYGEEVISVGGTVHGADSAIVIKPEYTSNILNTKISEIICKPYMK